MAFVDELYTQLQNKRNSGYTYRGTPVYNVTKSDISEIENVSNYFGFPPEWLANLINNESAGTFNPSIQNSIGATGLIQFLPSTAVSLGTTVDQLRNMDFKTQMQYVKKYLQQYESKLRNLGNRLTQTDIFMTIFYPASIGNPSYMFPAPVVQSNAGIQTPMDYTNRAIASAPFKDVPNVLSEAKQFVSNNPKTIIFGILSLGLLITTTIYYFVNRKSIEGVSLDTYAMQ